MRTDWFAAGWRSAPAKEWTPEEIAETCEAAADLLEDGGWIQGDWAVVQFNDDGTRKKSYCVEGALAAALGLKDPLELRREPSHRGRLVECPVYQAVRTTTGLGDSAGELAHWNDAQANAQNVIDTLHATAKRVLGVPRDDS